MEFEDPRGPLGVNLRLAEAFSGVGSLDLLSALPWSLTACPATELSAGALGGFGVAVFGAKVKIGFFSCGGVE